MKRILSVVKVHGVYGLYFHGATSTPTVWYFPDNEIIFSICVIFWCPTQGAWWEKRKKKWEVHSNEAAQRVMGILVEIGS